MNVQRMKKFILIRGFAAVVLGSAFFPCLAASRVSSEHMCVPLRAFVASVKAGETRKLEFHTSWGTGFKDSTDREIAAKRCIYNGYAPAEAVCDYLMDHEPIEFSDIEAKQAIECLSSGTHFGSQFRLHTADVDFSYGTERRGSNVTIQYDKDSKLGGMVLSITADGY
jgi:hypothetical protein